MKKLLSSIVIVCLVIVMASAALLSVGANEADYSLAGMNAAVTKAITVNGTETGVKHTQISLPSKTTYNSYNTDTLVNILEVPSAAENTTFAVLNCGSYNWSKTTMGNAVAKYNSSHDGTVIAAVNGDPWLVHHTDYDGDGVSSTGQSVKHGSLSRGILIVDGELYNTAQCEQENYLPPTTSGSGAEYGNAPGTGPVFAVKKDGTFMIGKPTLAIAMSNATTGVNLTVPNGINRLPAPDAIMIYNQRVGSESMAYEDAYEIYLHTDDSAFGIGKTVKGTVTAIYASGEQNRPAIDENTVIISARGTKIKGIEGKISVGDSINIKAYMRSDAYISSQKDDWNNVTQAIGGFFTQVEKGQRTGQIGNATAYPCPIIGLKQDGTAMIITVTSQEDGVRQGTTMDNLSKICIDLGMYTALMFDGGGSTQLITYEDGAYLRRAACPDGASSVRGVINGIAIVYNQELNVTNSEKGKLAFFEGISSKENNAFASVVNHINGVGTDGTADTNFAEVLVSNNDKLASADMPISIKEPSISVNGWFISNEGQSDEIKWSVDGGKTWVGTCTNVEWTDGTDDHVTAANAHGVKQASAAHAIFKNATADLTPYTGKTINVTFGRTASWGDTVAFATVTNVKVPGVARPDITITYNPSYAFAYAAHIGLINGQEYDEYGYRAPNYSSSMTPEEKDASIISPVISGITVNEDKTISVSGWGQMRMGILKYVWSVDKYNWYDCTGEVTEASGDKWTEIRDIGINQYGINGATSKNAIFNGLTADLSSFDGETVTVYFGMVPAYTGYTDRAMLFLTIEDVTVPHTPGDEATCTTAQTCTVCGKVIVEALGHDEVNHEGKAATCTEAGYKDYVTCTRCDYTTYEVVDALGHDEVQHESKAATCTENGWNAYVTCSRCDYTTYQETEKLGHDEVNHEGKAATCTEDGWKEYVTCTRCDYTTYEEIKSEGHKTEVIPAVPATCTEKGKTEGQKCTVCGQTTVTPTDTDALGHTEVEIPAVAATCTKTGLTAGKKCSVCNETLQAQEETPKTEHTYDSDTDATCNVCGAERQIENGNKEEPEPKNSGCGSSIGINLIGLTTALAAGFVLNKKKR